MSTAVIRKLLEDALASVPGAMPLALQNKAFKPVIGQAYGEVYLLPSMPDGFVLEDDARREQGSLQVTLCFPDNQGTSAVDAKTEQIRKRFRRGTAFLAPGIRVLVDQHLVVGPALPEPGWFRQPLRIHYVADIHDVV